MGQPAAKQNDQIVATDIHIVLVPAGIAGLIPTPLPHAFTGILNSDLSGNVKIMGLPAATVGSTADNTPAHLPLPPGTNFQVPPRNRGTVMMGSATVRINEKAVARSGDAAITCNDPADLPVGTVIAAGTVLIG